MVGWDILGFDIRLINEVYRLAFLDTKSTKETRSIIKKVKPHMLASPFLFYQTPLLTVLKTSRNQQI